jgi:hypothetical protein
MRGIAVTVGIRCARVAAQMIDAEPTHARAVRRDGAFRIDARACGVADLSTRTRVDLTQSEIDALLVAGAARRRIVLGAAGQQIERDDQPTKTPHGDIIS